MLIKYHLSNLIIIVNGVAAYPLCFMLQGWPSYCTGMTKWWLETNYWVLFCMYAGQDDTCLMSICNQNCCFCLQILKETKVLLLVNWIRFPYVKILVPYIKQHKDTSNNWVNPHGKNRSSDKITREATLQAHFVLHYTVSGTSSSWFCLRLQPTRAILSIKQVYKLE